MSVITGYNETAKVQDPRRIDSAHANAIEQNKYTAVLEQYAQWWDFHSIDNETFAKLPLGIYDWLSGLPDDIRTRACTYLCPFSIEVTWVRTHTRRLKPYVQPYWKTERTHAGILSISVNPSVKFTAKATFDNGESYNIGQYAAYKIVNGRVDPGNLVAVKVYSPNFQDKPIFWMSERILENTFDPCIVLLDARQATKHFLDQVNDLILPVLHAQYTALAFYPEISHQIKRSRTELLQAYRTVFETAYAKGKLLQILPTISQFQKAIIEALTQTVNTPTPSSMDGTEVCESILEIINEFVKTLYGLNAEIPKLL